MKKPLLVHFIGEPIAIGENLHIPLFVKETDGRGEVHERVVRNLVLPLDKVPTALLMIQRTYRQVREPNVVDIRRSSR